MSLSTAAGQFDKWHDADQFYGGMDLQRDLAAGKSANEIKSYMANNPGKFRSQVTRDMINNLQASSSSSGGGNSSGSAGSSYVPGMGGASLISGANQLEMPEWMRPEGGDIIRGSQVDVWTEEDFVNPGININESFNTDIEQTAEVDNSFTNNFGDNNIFGAGSNIGNQNATTMINQSAKGAQAAITGGYVNPYHGEAKDRAQNRLKLSNAMYAVD